MSNAIQSRSLSGRHVSTSFLDPVLGAMMKQICWHSRRSKAYGSLPEARMAALRLLRMCWSSRGLPRLLLAPFTASSESEKNDHRRCTSGSQSKNFSWFLCAGFAGRLVVVVRFVYVYLICLRF